MYSGKQRWCVTELAVTVHNKNYIGARRAFNIFASAGTYIRYIITAILLFTVHVEGERAKQSVVWQTKMGVKATSKGTSEKLSRYTTRIILKSGELLTSLHLLVHI